MQKIVSNDATAPVCENEKGIDFFASNPPNVLNLQYLALNAQNVCCFNSLMDAFSIYYLETGFKVVIRMLRQTYLPSSKFWAADQLFPAPERDPEISNFIYHYLNKE